MFEEFFELVVETWQIGIRGVGLNDLIICFVIIIGSLVARTLLNTMAIDRIAKLADRTESEFDDEIVESLRTPFGVIPIAFGFYLITAYLPLTGSLDLIMSPYSPVPALKPKLPFPSLILSKTTDASSPAFAVICLIGDSIALKAILIPTF